MFSSFGMHLMSHENSYVESWNEMSIHKMLREITAMDCWQKKFGLPNFRGISMHFKNSLKGFLKSANMQETYVFNETFCVSRRKNYERSFKWPNFLTQTQFLSLYFLSLFLNLYLTKHSRDRIFLVMIQCEKKNSWKK